MDRQQLSLVRLGILILIVLGAAWRQSRHAEQSPSAAEASDWSGRLSRAREVDVNAAGVAELERLPGIGTALARRIVAFREEHGPFSEIDEVQRVAGIGDKTLGPIRQRLKAGAAGE